MKQKRKGRWKIVVGVIALLVVALGLVVFFNLPKPLAAQDAAYDLNQLADGTYTGRCDNGIVQVEVEVEVQDHAITDVRILRHQNGLGASAEAITQDVVRRQSLEVDAVAGATMSSQTILKAIENALAEGMEN